MQAILENRDALKTSRYAVFCTAMFQAKLLQKQNYKSEEGEKQEKSYRLQLLSYLDQSFQGQNSNETTA